MTGVEAAWALERPASLIPGAGMDEDAIPPEEKPHLESIRQWVFDHTGLCFEERKRFVLYRRLETLRWRLGLSSLQDMAWQLAEQTCPQLAVQVACAVSTNHTFFFREIEMLQRLFQVATPQLPSGEVWRIWSAAAASGDEAYTMAILLAEALGMPQAQERAAILGTDISHPMIDQAEHGVYAEQKLELVPPSLFKRYFQPVGLGQWRVAPALKRMCTFRRMNLKSAPWPFKNPFHIILCRNVLYYFDRAHQERLVERLYDVAAPNGWLLTSATETLHGLNTRWRKVDVGIFRKAEG